MQLSIIIVNYNTRSLVEQCLISVRKAMAGIEGEIIIIDNNSTDGSKEYLKSIDVKYILNADNRGFAKACNQGYEIAAGKYILFLNPDTIIPETCLKECILFLENNSDAGAVGVRMVNSSGTFLKESKRGWPSPSASFYKLFGLAAIFPASKTFAKYYQGHLPEKSNNAVDVLSGAFLMVRKVVLDKINGFDEDFFMYGEDIDLSVRINESGYKTYYLGTVSVVHLKGGSTTYNYNYIHHFYGAMNLFVKKHYRNKPPWYRFFLNAGISIRKMLALVALSFR